LRQALANFLIIIEPGGIMHPGFVVIRFKGFIPVV
jgi:hypothetical protein